ncbi:MAG: 30S ribosomal protein S9 [Candidatus Shikimatogenerans sp. Ttur]|uniref:30S ribosomal protein S9 n=1 Tax=Candidatus Shikimatogenerans sp. Ttur TaxID=3158569 RepID=A0AAU7ZXD5_9FLAO
MIINNNKIKYIISKRKTTISRIFLKKGNGKIIVNNKKYKLYFNYNKYFIYKLLFFLKKIKFKNEKYNIYINILGGGVNSQIESIIYGITKLLYKFDIKYKILLKNNFFLRNDCRKVERKKFGKKKSRKSHQFSKR